MRAFSWATILALTTTFAFTSAAYADTWAVIPVGIGETPSNQTRSIAETSAAALETSGATVLQSAQLSHRVENELSQPLTTAPAELTAEIDQAEQDLAVAVAQRRWADVLSGTRALFDEVRPHLAALERDDAVRTDLSNLCGYRVLAAQRADSTGAAAARECLELLPRFSPDRGLHPPEILELVATTAGQLSSALVIETSADDAPNCAIRVNGTPVGTSPSARVAVPPGSYAVQVECGSETGRVHRAQVGSGDATVEVRASLDAALQSRPVALVYASPSAMNALPGDVAALGHAIGADRILAAVEGPSGVVLRAFEIGEGDAPAHQLREATVGLSSDEGRIRESVARLAATALGNPALPTEPSTRESMSPWGPVVLSVGGAALVAAAIVGGVALSENGQFRTACTDLSACPPSTRPQYDHMRLLAGTTDALLIGGAATAVVGLILTLVLRDVEQLPATVACGMNGCQIQGRF